MNLKKKKGQGAFEYILLVAGILLIVVIVVFLLKGGLQAQAGSGGVVSTSTEKININVESQCLDFCGPGAWAAYGVQNSDFANTNCTLAEGVNGNSSCYYSATTIVNNGLCNATYVLKPNVAQSKGLLNSSGATVVHPQNTQFCTYVRQARAG
ncbi:MAG: class III signal peptide-containing protein [Candidatus Micrarchaeia archaeon]